MNLLGMKCQADEILSKLKCSLCSFPLDKVYRSESGKFHCSLCVVMHKSAIPENNAVFNEFWTNINAMFKELRLCLQNEEQFNERKMLPPNKNKRRKIDKSQVDSPKNTNEVFKFFTCGAGANFFKAHIESCLSISSETAAPHPTPVPANKEEQSAILDEAESSFPEQNNSLLQDSSQSNSKEIVAENAAMVEEAINGINDIHQQIETPQKLINTDVPQSPEVSENDSDIDLFVPPTPETKLRQSKNSFMGTALSPKSKLTLQKFARFFSVTLVDNLSYEFDCLFVENATVTWKYLYARCKKIPIVRFEWVVDSLNEERFLPLGPYKINEEELDIPSFFQNLNLILCPPFSSYSTNDVKAVLEATGAKVCNFDEWQPGLKELKTPRLFVGANDTIPFDDLTLTRMVVKYRAPIVDISYFVPVLQTGKLKNIENHLIVPMAEEDLLYLGFPKRLTVRTDSDEDDDYS